MGFIRYFSVCKFRIQNSYENELLGTVGVSAHKLYRNFVDYVRQKGVSLYYFKITLHIFG